MIKQFTSLVDLMVAFRKPQAAIDHFTAIRWKHGQFCPHCGHDKIYKLAKLNQYRCAQCKTNFSIMVGTIFENTKLPLRIWFGAIWLLTNHPKGIASTTLAKDLNITQKSAWFVLHRLRHAARTGSFNAPLTGKVEVDETFIGGKSINKHGRSNAADGPSEKTTVIGAVERNGGVVARVIPSVARKELHEFIYDVVSPDTELLVTDAFPAYSGLVGYKNHQVVNHRHGEYRKGDAHTNSIESIWALLKRQIVGTHHWISPKHLQRYVDEITWRLNNRAMTTAERVNALFTHVEGRLTYKALIG